MLIFASSLRLSLSLICVVIAELNIDDVNKYNKYTYFENSLFDWRGKSEYMFNCPFMCPDYCAQNLLILSCHETCNCKTQQPQTAQGITDISTNITRKSTDYRVLKDNINHQFLNQESSYEICLSECSDFCRGIESSPGTCMNLCIEELCPTQKSHTNTLND